MVEAIFPQGLATHCLLRHGETWWFNRRARGSLILLLDLLRIVLRKFALQPVPIFVLSRRVSMNCASNALAFTVS
jgi:hypothetical protein